MTDIASPQPTRRDFLYIATAAMGAVGAAAASIPFISQMKPDAATLAAGGPVDVGISKIAPGQQISVRWRERPIFLINRPPEALKSLQDSQLVDQLADPGSAELQQPPYAKNWHRSVKPELMVLVGICTHLGCIPLFYPTPNASQPVPQWLGGYFARVTARNTISPVACSRAYRRPITYRFRPITMSMTQQSELGRTLRPPGLSSLPFGSCSAGRNFPGAGAAAETNLIVPPNEFKLEQFGHG
jgi:ubiquinol-cytochrome c reductase iron-sulfur subunit